MAAVTLKYNSKIGLASDNPFPSSIPIPSLQRLRKPELLDHAHMSLAGYQTSVINFGHFDVSGSGHIAPFVAAPGGF
jgi:hypothetical protein